MTTSNTTQLLLNVAAGNDGAADSLLRHVYSELHDIAVRHFRRQPGDHTLQPTALVHEAYMKLIDQARVGWTDRAHFLAVASRAMRQILVDHARAQQAVKRGGAWGRVTLDAAPGYEDDPTDPIDVVALDAALNELAEIDPRQAEVVQLRFFGGLTVKQTAAALGVSDRTVELDWRMAKAWLSRALTETETEPT